ncbi:hypothetical protein [Streptomyces sp. NBC_01373]|uniref:hypothetical protein n=1 Tax=unclassified Streptomyces TaxID=2593676 RepID=UPI002252436F|nr:hypothetical protein [Streptomyces sp. NBC_01373]MCX4703592.1 hypothetical protein [Streptomyces sp. NBC_01373]
MAVLAGPLGTLGEQSGDDLIAFGGKVLGPLTEPDPARQLLFTFRIPFGQFKQH